MDTYRPDRFLPWERNLTPSLPSMLTTTAISTWRLQTGLTERLLCSWVMGTGTLRLHQQRPCFHRYHEVNTMKPRTFLSIALATVATAAVLITSLEGQGQSPTK